MARKQTVMLTDFLLGLTANKKYSNKFTRFFVPFSYSLEDIEFVRDAKGNYKFKEIDLITEPFIDMTKDDPAVGHFLICFQQYLKEKHNFIFKSIKNGPINLPESFTGFLKIEGFKDWHSKVLGAFVYIDKSIDDIIISYVYESGQIGYYKSSYKNFSEFELSPNCKLILKTLSRIKEVKMSINKVKKKEEGKFTHLQYQIIV